MSKKNASPLIDWRELSKLERKITADEHGGIMHRWLYGREVLKAKAGRRQLPDGMIETLVQAGDRGGKSISATEIRYRIRFAEAYANDQQVIRLSADLGTWNAIIEAGFPEVSVDVDADAVDEAEVLPDWEQPPLLPGLKPVLKINKLKIPLGEALVADGEAYEQMCLDMHDGFGKTVAQVQDTMRIVRLGCAGDRSMNLLEAYDRGQTLSPT